MKKLLPKLKALEQQISSEKGQISLFGLFLRDESPGKWELVISGPWVDTGQLETYEYLAERLHAALSPEERYPISKFLPLKEGSPIVEAILDEVTTENGIAEVRDCDFHGISIRKGYVFTAKRRSEWRPVAATT